METTDTPSAKIIEIIDLFGASAVYAQSNVQGEDADTLGILVVVALFAVLFIADRVKRCRQRKGPPE